MHQKPVIVRPVMTILFVCGLFLLGGGDVQAQDPELYMAIDSVDGYIGELVEIPIYIQTLADSLDGFEISLALSRPDLVYFEVDTVVVGDETSFVCQFDTVGTLASGWQHVEVRSTVGKGLELRLSGISDIGSGGTPGIPDYTSGILMNIYGRIRSDIPDTLTDRIVRLDVHSSTTYYSNQLGELIIPVENTDGSVTVETAMRGDTNCDYNVNPVDVVFLVNYVYKNWDLPCNSLGAADINCDTNVNPVDVVFLVNYVYKNWAMPDC